MESLILNPESKNQIAAYMKDNHMVPYESGIFLEMIATIQAGDQAQLDCSVVSAIHLEPSP